jgi:hypothetical protein
VHSKELTEIIIGCAYTIANTLGNGFLEKVYENALAYELRKKGFATGLEICMLINFGTPKVQIKRIVNSNQVSRTERAEG